MTHCPRCGKDNPAEIHTCTPRALVLADELTTLTGTQKAKRTTAKQAADELRGLHAEVQMQFQALKAARQLVEACYQSAKKDEALLRQALDTLAYWLEHGETPGAHDMIQRAHDILQERLK